MGTRIAVNMMALMLVVAIPPAISRAGPPATGAKAQTAKPQKEISPEEIERDRKFVCDYHQLPEAREAEIRRLRAVTSRVLPELLLAVRREPDKQTRIAAIHAATAAVVISKAVYPVELIELVFDGDAEVRSLGAMYLGLGSQYPPEATDLLVKAMHAADADTRSSAATALGRPGASPKVAERELKEALHDSWVGVRGNAATALWHRTKEPDLVVPVWAAVVGSREPLPDKKKECMRNLFGLGQLMCMEDRAREKPDEVCTALLREFQSPSADVRLGAALLTRAVLRGKDPKLVAKREELRAKLRGMASGTDARLQELAELALRPAAKGQPAKDAGKP